MNIPCLFIVIIIIICLIIYYNSFRYVDISTHIANVNGSVIIDWEGAQWLSGRVLDSRPKGRRFEPHRRHCVVVLEQDTFILA